MSTRRQYVEGAGFALVLTLSLLALLVLLVYAVSSVSKVDGEISNASSYQVQARQNALVALHYSLAELQVYAGTDNHPTGMAGVVGIVSGDSRRQLTGIWGNGVQPRWLVSGAVNGGVPAINGSLVNLVGPGSIGTPGGDQEQVDAGLVDISDGAGVQGHFAYWVGDEGVKVSAVVPDAEAQTAATSGRTLRLDSRRILGTNFDPTASNLEQAISFEQLSVAGTTHNAISLTGAFHNLTRTHWALPSTAPSGVALPSGYVRGAFNINTTSVPAWRGLLDYPDRSNSAYGLSAATSLANARKISDRIQARGAPFADVGELVASGMLQDAFASTPNRITTMTAQEFVDDIGAILAVRSDTFRIRAYGDALNRADAAVAGAVPEAIAYCEAIVQRTATADPSGHGKKFVVTYFRWLGPNDI